MGKIYSYEHATLAANRATAGERAMHNRAVDAAKRSKNQANRSTFTSRKASHKQG